MGSDGLETEFNKENAHVGLADLFIIAQGKIQSVCLCGWV